MNEALKVYILEEQRYVLYVHMYNVIIVHRIFMCELWAVIRFKEVHYSLPSDKYQR